MKPVKKSPKLLIGAEWNPKMTKSVIDAIVRSAEHIENLEADDEKLTWCGSVATGFDGEDWHEGCGAAVSRRFALSTGD